MSTWAVWAHASLRRTRNSVSAARWPAARCGPGVSRIGPVYTPRERRGRGYASAAVAQVSRMLCNQGVRIYLFTDQANPTSNGIYQALGFRPTVDMANLLIR